MIESKENVINYVILIIFLSVNRVICRGIIYYIIEIIKIVEIKNVFRRVEIIEVINIILELDLIDFLFYYSSVKVDE